MSVSPLPYQAIFFGPGGSLLFGWYHAPVVASKGAWRNAGVVIGNPIGDDYVRAHRALRRLALSLADAGFAVLRFDFRGTGDSAGSERDAGCAAGWASDVRLALDELRARSGAKTMCVVGMKLGATVAATATRGDVARVDTLGDVASLVLWSPFVSGKAFVNEATQLHRMHEILEPQSFTATPRGWNGGGREALGFLLTKETVDVLEKIDLSSLAAAPADGALIIGVANTPADNQILSQLRELGVTAEYRHIPGQKFLVQVPHRAEVPVPVIDEITQWLGARHPVVFDAAPLPTKDDAGDAARGASSTVAEEPLTFGRDHALFGVLHHPPPPLRDPARPAIIMSNAGTIHRIGPHRFYVPMARRWAALGFSVLRMDVSGVGDSPAAPGCAENLTHPRDGIKDIEGAMDAVSAATGATRFVVFGHCSGGDLAFQLGLRDPRVVGAMMLNPRTFCVNDLAMVESYKGARYYQRSLFRAESWKKALRGDVDFRRALGIVAPKFVDLVKRKVSSLLTKRAAEGPDSEDVAANLRAMAERGVDTFLLAVDNDPGVDFVDVRSGEAMEALESVRGFRRETFRGMDHTFTSLYAQEKLAEVLTEHLAARHLAPTATAARATTEAR